MKMFRIYRYKISLLLLLFAYGFPAIANMASPMQTNQEVAFFSSSDIAITHEQLNVKLLTLNKAFFDITYTIKIDTIGSTLPLIFDCSQRAPEDFQVIVDDKEIEVKDIPAHISITSDSLFSGRESSDLRYFEVETLDVGLHTIQVLYSADADVDSRAILKVFNLFYNLEPAHSWKSYENLEINIDSSLIEADITTNLSDKYKVGDGLWQMKTIDYNELNIKIEPKLSWFQRYISELNSTSLVLVMLLIYGILHSRFQKKNREKNRRATVIVGGVVGVVLMPVIITFIFVALRKCLISAVLPSELIGNRAGGFYTNLLVFVLLVVVAIPLYTIWLFILDAITRSSLKKRQEL